MSTSTGNWFTNQKEVSDKIQNLDSDGNIEGDVKGMIYHNPAPSPETSSGTISTTVAVVGLNTAYGVLAMTLPAGSPGQRMVIVCTDATNSAVVTADFGGTTATLTFDTAGESADLVFYDSAWFIVGLNGATPGS